MNISSVAGVRGVGSSVAYVASKGAEFDDAGLRARWARIIFASMRCVPALSARTGSAMRWARKCLTALSTGKKSTPMHRAGTPDDISGPILFFANRASKHVTGQLLVVDAGMLLGMPVKIG